MVKYLIKKALITLARVTNIGQSKFIGTVSNYEAIHPYGFLNKMEPGSLVIQFPISGAESNQLGIEYNNKKISTMMGQMVAGDIAIYNPDSNSFVLMKKDGDIKILGKKDFEVDVTGSATLDALDLTITSTTTHIGDVAITGNLTVSGTIISTGAITAPDAIINGKSVDTHVHAAAGLLDSVSGPCTGATSPF